MEPLTKPRKSKLFEVGRILVEVNWAKSSSWALDDNRGYRYVFLFSILLLRKGDLTALQIFIGKLKLTFGILPKEE